MLDKKIADRRTAAGASHETARRESSLAQNFGEFLGDGLGFAGRLQAHPAASTTSQASKSSLRFRIREAARTTSSMRRSTGTRLHSGKSACASSIARVASSGVAL